MGQRTTDHRGSTPAWRRDRLAMKLALVTVVVLCATFVVANSTKFLMPGPLARAHGAIEACNICHASSGDGKLGWVRGLVADDRLADSKACVACHKMPETAFNPHGASTEALRHSTMRLTNVAANTPVPHSAWMQSFAFPTEKAVSGGLACATCHQEHQGASFDLKKLSNEKCHSCHAVKFDSFDGRHPEFGSYPFRRRTRIIFDHVGHFGKHFPETAAKTPANSIPDMCSTCHDSGKDKRIMAVLPFEQTCSGCHLDQITGKERSSGPKGLAFLSLPGLDLQTLKKKKADIGEWPDASEAALTPFMKVLIGRNKRGRDLIKNVAGLNFQDLSTASNEQIRAVVNLAWEIKGLFYTLIKGLASDALAELDISGAKLSAATIAELTANIPRDVVVGAQLQWLPNLGTEMAQRPDVREPQVSDTVIPPNSDVQAGVKPSGDGRASPSAGANTTPAAAAENAARKLPAVQPTGVASANPGRPTGGGRSPPTAADQTDDLLFPTDEEQRAMGAGRKGAKQSAPLRDRPAKNDRPSPRSDGAAAADNAPKAATSVPAAPGRAAAVVGIQSDVEPESWAAYGGWYRQDHAIFYRPVGHKDKLILNWLRLTGAVTEQGDANPATAVFGTLTDKQAQGSCTKCHSIDQSAGSGRTVNFSPLSAHNKVGRFTGFVHEPHFGILDKRGCLSCHTLEKSNPYLATYEQGDPQSFTPNFSSVKKELCQTCHTSSAARQDCLTCHKYHVPGPVTPIMKTKIPAE